MSVKEKMYGKLNRDVKFSVLLGPFRILVPAVGYAILYPLLLKYSSLKVVGIWSLISSLVYIASLGDVGFSQLLTRDAIDKGATSGEIWSDYYAATRFYLLLTVLLLVCILVLSIGFDSLLPVNETKIPFVLILLTVVVGAGLQLINKLDGAILAAKHDFYTVQYVGILSQLFLFIPAIVGAIGHVPLEGLAFGTFISSLFSWYVVKRRVPTVFPEFSTRFVPSWPESLRHLFLQISRGRHFYAISLAMLVRIPLTRVVIAGSAGLEGVAVFDIAMRVTQAIRDVVASGLGVLFPAFSKLFRDSELDKLIQIARKSLISLIAVGGVSLTSFVLLADWFFKLWLGNVPDFVVVTSLILAGWQLIALLNVPFWFILLATGQERVASLSIWCHTLLMLLAAPVFHYFHGSVDQVAIYWTLSSLITQALIYYHVQRAHKVFWRIVGGLYTPLLLAITLIGFGCASFNTYSNEPLGPSIFVVLALQFVFSIFAINVLFGKRHRWSRLFEHPDTVI